MATYPLPTPTDTDLWILTGAPDQYAVLGGVYIKVDKDFAATVSPSVTIDGPTGETITGILSVVANIWPTSVEVVAISGDYYVQFDTTITFFVQLASGNTATLADKMTAQGLLGSVSDLTPSDPLVYTAPVLTPTGISFTSTTVTGAIDVSAFTVEALESKSVKVAVDPTDPIGDPLI